MFKAISLSFPLIIYSNRTCKPDLFLLILLALMWRIDLQELLEHRSVAFYDSSKFQTNHRLGQCIYSLHSIAYDSNKDKNVADFYILSIKIPSAYYYFFKIFYYLHAEFIFLVLKNKLKFYHFSIK